MDIRIIKRLHEFVITERTGTPKELAAKLGVSERSVYNYISYMKNEMNAPITYDNQKGNYFYKRECELSFEG
ncbi:HTH domain-containing protein [Flavobacterium sandaracinum]|uniref:HTH domain-containing protein n=1 Tax=Flavobacterium sandaracinum TaxID=2541733 RepID=A0A4R5D1X4_9FLAO|nr:HTH domain-containing protein [Flavobacterium sandaracinum]TDE04275.1 HTH domain-containing protein [Flavobacterium sandaracinum]